MKQVYLLTGRPGAGKTSLIKQLTAKHNRKPGLFMKEGGDCDFDQPIRY
ncbi:GTP-binding protein [Chloroflexota bacterium]